MRTHLVSAALLGFSMMSTVPVHAASDTPGASAVKPGAVKPGAVSPGRVTMRTLSCVVQGTPVEFPNDITIHNVGSDAINAGTTIKWMVNPSIEGIYQLTSTLPQNKTALLADVVAGGLPAGTPCSASVVTRRAN
jgi:hypothetical protein